MIIDYNLMNESWLDFFNRQDIIDMLNDIEKNISKKSPVIPKTPYYPLKNEIFRFTRLNLNEMKYILMGMDPYFQSYKVNGINYPVANGRAFEPRNCNSWLKVNNNASIRNFLKAIYFIETGNIKTLKEIREEIKNNTFKIRNPHEWFDSLEIQGVLFLNYALTVKPNVSGSHLEYWEEFTKELINYIDNNYNIDFLLLGNEAKKIKKLIKNGNTICDSHPAINDFVKNNQTFATLKNNGIIIT